MGRVRSIFIASVVTASVSLAGSADAFERGTLFVSPDVTKASATYPAIVGVRPSACSVDCAANVATPYAATQAKGCKEHNAAYCDAIRLDVEVPAGYPDDLYELILTLEYDRGANNNKLDLYVFEEEHLYSGPSVVDNRKDEAPKKVRIYTPNPDRVEDDAGNASATDTKFADADGIGSYWVTVINERGTNSGYKLTANWLLTDLGPDYYALNKTSDDVPSNFKPSSSVSRPSARTGGTVDAESVAVDSQGRRVVRVPGPDGKLREVTLPTLARGDRSPGVIPLIDPVIASIVVALLLAGGVILFFAIKQQRAQNS